MYPERYPPHLLRYGQATRQGVDLVLMRFDQLAERREVTGLSLQY
jgi:hypothetical protein